MLKAQAILFRLLGILALISVFAQAIHAADEPPVVKALYDTFAEVAGDRPVHAALDVADDGTITITDVTLILSAHQDDGVDVRNEFKAASAVLQGVNELSPGLFEISSVKISGAMSSVGTPTETIVSSEMPVIEMAGLIVRSPDLIKTAFDRVMATQMLARHTSIPTMVLKIEDFSLIVQDMDYRWQGDPATGMGEWKMAIGSIPVPEDVAEMGQGPFSLEALGYDRMELAMNGTSSLGEADGKLEGGFDITLTLKGMGAFRIALAAGKIEPALFEALQALQKSPENFDTNAVMTQAQAITVSRVLFRYDDASLIGRLMEQFQKAEGKTREEIIAEMLQTSEMGLMGLNTPELSAMAQEALKTFLENPGFIQIEAAPGEPVSVMQALQLLASPAEIAKLANVTVTAGPPGAQ